jgi:hypothetical protein
MHVAYHNGDETVIANDRETAVEKALDSLGVKLVETQIDPEYLTSRMNGQVFSHLDEQAQQDVLFDELLLHVPMNDIAQKHVLKELEGVLREMDTPADLSIHDSDDYEFELYDWIDTHVDRDTFTDPVTEWVENQILDELRAFIDSHWSRVTKNIGNPALADDSEIEAEIDRLEGNE